MRPWRLKILVVFGGRKGRKERKGKGEEWRVFCFEWNGHCVGGEMML